MSLIGLDVALHVAHVGASMRNSVGSSMFASHWNWNAVASGIRGGTSVATVHRIAEQVGTAGVPSVTIMRREPHELLEEIGPTIISLDMVDAETKQPRPEQFKWDIVEFKDLEQALGMKYNPLGMLADVALRKEVHPASMTTFDAMHCLVSGGLYITITDSTNIAMVMIIMVIILNYLQGLKMETPQP